MIEIYGKDNCPYCDMAKGLAERNKAEFVYKQLDIDYGFTELREKFPGARTFPQITVDGERIGGYSDLEEYFNGL
jgi:glutaredoxin 3